MTYSFLKIVLSTLLLTGGFIASAQTAQEEVAQGRGRFGVGYVAAYPAPLFALNLEADLGAGLGVAAMLAPAPLIGAYGVKGKLEVARDPKARLYGFGLAMLITSLSYNENGELGQLQPSYGGGVGFSFLLPSNFSDSVQAWGSLELGLINHSPFSSGTALVISSGVTFFPN